MSSKGAQRMKVQRNDLGKTAALLALYLLCHAVCAQSPRVETPRSNAVVSGSKATAISNASASSLTVIDLPIVEPYKIGCGDVLNISVWKEHDLSPTVTVRPDGKISMPLVGELTVTGLTPNDIEQLLRTRLASIVVDPRVTVTVAEIHSRMVYITGEVARPGAYPLNSPLNVLQLIAQAGGLTQFAARKKITVIAPNSSGAGVRLDYNKLIHSPNSSQAMWLTPGTTVVVP
jgi:polysaccharide export outer membrane protein